MKKPASGDAGRSRGADAIILAEDRPPSARQFVNILNDASRGQNSDRAASALQTAALRDNRGRRKPYDHAALARHERLRACERYLAAISEYRDRLDNGGRS